MAVQDGLQNSGTLTATTTGTSAVAFSFRASQLKITAATSGGVFVDITGGVGVLATTSASYPLSANEALTVPLVAAKHPAPYYTGFSILAQVSSTGSGATQTVRYIALA